MFTGLIESIGTVKRVAPMGNYLALTIAPEPMFNDLVTGESIAVAGPCLTVTSFDAASFTVEASQETTRLTTLQKLLPGDAVNLERALRADGRLGGHMVAGHIDCTLPVTRRQKVGKSLQISVGLPPEYARFVVDRGSVALNGVSLTVMGVDARQFTVNLIPESQKRTTLIKLRVGDEINVEFDLVGKYILRSLEGRGKSSALTIESMRKLGY